MRFLWCLGLLSFLCFGQILLADEGNYRWTDVQTGLSWVPLPGRYTWDEAQSLCSRLNPPARLPTLSEMENALRHNFYPWAYYLTADSGNSWSGTENSADKRYAWYLDVTHYHAEYTGEGFNYDERNDKKESAWNAFCVSP